jgi:hypothetical protein
VLRRLNPTTVLHHDIDVYDGRQLAGTKEKLDGYDVLAAVGGAKGKGSGAGKFPLPLGTGSYSGRDQSAFWRKITFSSLLFA